MSTIIQEIDFITKDRRLAKAEIGKINDSEYICTIHSDNTKGCFSTLPSSMVSSAKECFKTLLEQIKKVISIQFPDDALEKIDNICNCPYISKAEEQMICGPSISVLVNGV